MNSPVSGWQRDPTARHEYRYWDGSRWTDDVSDRGVTSTDPMTPAPGAMGPPPAPGAMGPPPGAGPDPTQVIDPTQSYPMAPAAPTQSYGQPGAGYQNAAPGFGPYGTLPNNQPGSYGSYGSGGVPPAPGPKPDSGAKTGLFVGIGVLVLALLGVGAFLLTKDDDKSDETSTSPLSDQTDPGSDTTDGPTTTDPGDSSDTTDPGDIGSLGDLENVDPSDITEDMVIPLLTEELVNSGGLTEEQATCVSEALFDQVSIDELVQIGESGDVMGTLSPDQVSALAESISNCGVG